MVLYFCPSQSRSFLSFTPTSSLPKIYLHLSNHAKGRGDLGTRDLSEIVAFQAALGSSWAATGA